jgi:enamine deaminase RidA (YjgF/YER057c/UK114 family)
MISKISISKAMLLGLTLIPIISSAQDDKTTLDVYQNIIGGLKAKHQVINQLTVDVQQKLLELKKEAENIKTLIAKYEAVLETNTQQPPQEHNPQLTTASQNALKKLKEAAKLAEQARQSAEKDAKAAQAILDELGITVENIVKLTNVIDVSSDENVININGSYTLVITDRACANQKWYAEIDTQHQGSLLLDIRASFNHCTSGCHWAFRHLEVLFNAYTSQVILSDTNNNGNGAGEWTLTRIATNEKYSEKMRLEKSAGTQKWCGPIDIKIESNQPIKLSKTETP